MAITMQVLKMDLLRKKLEALPEAVAATVHNALAQSAEEIVATAKALVPVDHGVLRDSITWAWGEQNLVRKDGKKSSGYGLFGAIKRGANQPKFAVSIGCDIGYLKQHKRPIQLPRWVEFGTAPQKKGQKVVNLDRRGRITRVRRAAGDHAGMPARPFLLPAYQIHKKNIRARVGKAVRAALDHVKKMG